MAIGMSVPGATDLGLGTALSDQVAGETEEQRRKRMQQMQQQRLGIGASALGLNPLGSLGGL